MSGEIVEASTYTIHEQEEEDKEAWKVVGSPARRASVADTPQKGFSKALSPQQPGQQGPPGFMNQNIWKVQPSPTPEISIMTSEEYNDMPKQRSRSKSSSAIFGEEDQVGQMPDISKIWNQPVGHRRASTQPSQQTLMWEALRAAQLATPTDLNGANTDELRDRWKQ